MKSINKQEDIYYLIQSVKENSHSFTTNFFMDGEKTKKWIEDGLISYYQSEYGVLLFRKSNGFLHLYYGAQSLKALAHLLIDNPADEPCVVDIIGKEPDVAAVMDVFSRTGFKVHTCLHRYVRINTPTSNFYSADDTISVATTADNAMIADMLLKNFDKFSEQIPTLEDVAELTDQQKVIIIKEEDVIKGFLIRTFNGQSTILNNFLVGSSFRGERVGSRLLKHYIFEARDVKRMMLWVLCNNEKAKKMYQQHGYTKDSIVDFIMINK